jgi:hypothetical protein
VVDGCDATATSPPKSSKQMRAKGRLWGLIAVPPCLERQPLSRGVAGSDPADVPNQEQNEHLSYRPRKRVRGSGAPDHLLSRGVRLSRAGLTTTYSLHLAEKVITAVELAADSVV